MTHRPAPRPRASVAAVTAVVFGLLAGACAATDVGTPRAAHADAVPGGTATVAIAPPASIDPGNAFEPMGTMIARLACDTLLDVDRDSGELVPAIAESFQVLDDGLRVALRLREGVRFHDGTALDAEDVVFSLARAASASFAGQSAHLLSAIDGYAVIRGQEETDFAAHRERLRGVRLVTDRTVELRFGDRVPRADLVALLTHPVAAPVSRTAARADPEGFARQPVCAGPYRFTEPWEPGDRELALTRFEDYHGHNLAYSNGGAGYVDDLVFTFTEDPRPRLADPGAGPEPADGAGTADQQDGTDAGADGTSEDDEPARDPVVAPPAPGRFDVQLLGPGNRETQGQRTVSAVGPSIDYIGLPVDRFPAAVRVALSQALDRTAIAQETFDGERVPATGFLPPTVGATYRPDACATTVPATADVAAARATLRAAGEQVTGQSFEVLYNDELRNRELVEAVAQQWRDRLDLNVSPRPATWDEFQRTTEAVAGGGVAFRFSWSVPYPSADAYLHPLFHTAGTGQANLTGFSDPEFEQDLQEVAREATDAEDRVLAYRSLEDRLCDQLPLIPVTFDLVRYAVGSALATASTFVDPVTAEPLLREVYRP